MGWKREAALTDLSMIVVDRYPNIKELEDSLTTCDKTSFNFNFFFDFVNLLTKLQHQKEPRENLGASVPCAGDMIQGAMLEEGKRKRKRGGKHGTSRMSGRLGHGCPLRAGSDWSLPQKAPMRASVVLWLASSRRRVSKGRTGNHPRDLPDAIR